MKGIFTVLGLFFILCCTTNVLGQQFKWFRGGGTNDDLSFYATWRWEKTKYMCTDSNGNVYALNIVGSTAVTADTFHATTGTPPDANNILIASYNCSGQMRWAKLISSGGYLLRGHGIAADNLGHIYVAGRFDHNSSYPLHIGSDTTISTNDYNTTAIIQFDTSGHYHWVKFVGNNAITTATGLGGSCLILDTANNAHFICGTNSGIVLRAGDTTHGGQYDLMYNASGNLVTTKRLTLDSTLALSGGVIDRQSGKLYVYGARSATYSGLTNYPYVASLDTGGRLIWIDTLGTTPGYAAVFAGIATDNGGHLYFAGQGQNIITYNSDTVSGGSVSFIIKADTSGNPKWLRGYIGNVYNDMTCFTLMPNNKMAAVGTILGRIIGGQDTINSYSGESYNSYFTVLDTGGYVHVLQQIHCNATYDYGWAIASDKVGNLYVGGEVDDSTWGGSVGYRTMGGNTDFFVTKFGVDCSCSTMPVATYADTGTHTVGFTYTGPTSGIDSIRWDFGDGNTSSATSPTHTYTMAGTFHACVLIYSFCGNDMHCTDIVLSCIAAPTTTFTSTGTSATRNFSYTGTTVGMDSVVWSFGDGGHGTGLTASHTYTAMGTYSVCVTAYNHCGSNTACSTITVTCISLPSPSYTSAGTGNTRTFTYTGTTTAIDSVVWHFGDGGHASGTGSSHTYSSIGTFTVCVIAYTPCGRDSSCATVTIPCTTAPTATFTYSGMTTVLYVYTGTTSALDSISWDFGDGTHGTGTSPTHTYSAVGSFTVCATAYNPCGSTTVCHTINIPCIVAPVASFAATGTAPVNFTYSGTSAGLDSVVWYFGDGSRSTGLTVTHSYAIPDTYNVCVYAYNPCGWDSACANVIIPCDTAHASFSHSGTKTINLNYTGTSTSVDSVVWLYGDGSHGAGMTTSHDYTTSGTYHVCVIAYTNCAVDSVCSDIYIIGTSVTTPALATIEVFPNPAKDQLTISGILAVTNYRLLNVAGISLQQGVFQKGKNSVDLKGYAPGVYVLEVIGGDGVKCIVRVVKG